MDMSGAPYNNDAVLGNLPMGFGMALAMNEPAMRGYAGLTEAQKEEILMRCKDVKTKEEMQRVVDSLVPGADVQEIYEEERTHFL